MRFRASDVAAATGGRLSGPDTDIDGVSFDSRTIRPGQLFVPIVDQRDGHDFIDRALESGAAAYLTSRAPTNGTAIEVDDTLQALKNLSRLTGRPRAWFTNRAAVQGLSRPKFREPDWCDAELAILDAKAHLSPGYIRELLRDAGYRRTVNAIVIKLRRRRGWQREKADSRYSKLMLMECFGVSGGVLSRWAADYGLKVEREWRMAGDRHEPPSPKAEWNVRASELRRFVADNVAIIDFRKVDKFWLVDLLTSRGDPEAVGEARARGRGTTNKGDDA